MSFSTQFPLYFLFPVKPSLFNSDVHRQFNLKGEYEVWIQQHKRIFAKKAMENSYFYDLGHNHSLVLRIDSIEDWKSAKIVARFWTSFLEFWFGKNRGTILRWRIKIKRIFQREICSKFWGFYFSINTDHLSNEKRERVD